MKLFFRFALQEFTAAAMYRLEFWMRLLSNLIQMYGVYWLWNTLYLQRPGLISTTLEQMLTYALLAMVLDGVMMAANLPNYYVAYQVHTGAIQSDLLRPVDFPFYLIARSVGSLIFLLSTQGFLAALLGAVFLGIRGPASLVHALLFLPSVALAFLVGFGMNFLMGMVAIYTVQTGHISWVYQAVMGFFSGRIIPLWIFPPVLAQIAALLPFQSIIGVPLSIYIGQLPVPAALQAMGIQALWAAVLLGSGQLLWNKARAHLSVQGG